MKPLKDKVALITGSARGLGKAIAERYASLGANIVINYARDEAAAIKTLENIKKMNVEAIVVRADISIVSEIENLFTQAIDHFGRIDIIVANAGIELIDQVVADFTEEQFDLLFGINTKGAFFTLQKAGKYVADNGRVIYIGSGTTSQPFSGIALYGGSKMAPRLLVEVLAKEIGHRGVTVNSIIPTAINGAGVFSDQKDDAPFKKHMKRVTPLGRMGRMEDVANVAEFFASELSSFVTGQHLLVS